ncbi:pro-cathepsin H [Brassica rapa]|uniref:pro-cathepsin H n=1 Tax=Brassica campestris TaxID=3711 RepID=UPI0004F183A7|nr:pro-cathepsin H [Brassica rapa]
MGKDDLPPLGGKPHGKEKVPNKYRKTAAAARENPPTDQPQPQDDEFGDGSGMSKDWRKTPNAMARVIKQKLDICWAIVLTYMLQAITNISNPNDYVEFLYQDLVVHLKLKKKTKKQVQPGLKLANLQKAIGHIAHPGLLKEKSSGAAKAGSKTGFHGKWQFQTEISPSADFIKARVEHSPVAISFEVDTDFHELKKNIYKVGDTTEPLEEGEVEGHAVLIVGYGYTKNRQLFFLVQNSWGDDWGVKGFGRIFIDESSKTTLVYPVV